MPRDDVHGDYLDGLRAVAAARGAAMAIVDDVEAHSYSALIEQIDHRADRLVSAGLQPGDRVALVAQNSAAFMVSCLAVWSAGGVLVTIYPSGAPDDIRYAVQDADPVLVLADKHTVVLVREVTADVTPVALIDAADFEPQPVGPTSVPNPTDLREPLFLICYSSGTTSRPKAIMLSQAALFNGARTYADVWRLTSEDTTLVCLPMAWLYGLASTSMATLLAGGTVVPLRRARPELVLEAIERHGVTVLPGVTTIFAKLVEHAESVGAGRELTSLRLAVSGGEPRNEAAFDRFTAISGVAVHDTFCASECFPLITYDPVDDPRPRPGSAGRLVPRSELKVLDPEGNPVLPGEPGEAFSRGVGLMLGYWRDEGLTKHALTKDGWYRTKDLVRVDEDGYVYVVGRLSDMIIRGGSNVSPAEVERALREHPSVRDAVVGGLPDPVYGQEVVAVVVLRDGNYLDVPSLRAYLAERLSSYKIPTRWQQIDQLPTNMTTGKVDRAAAMAAISAKGPVSA